MSFETPPPYGDDRENLPPVPPELDAPPPQNLPGAAPASPAKGQFLTWFIIAGLLNCIPGIGILTGFVCIITGVIGMATTKDPKTRANFGGLAAGGGIGMIVSASLCISALTSSGI